MQANFIIIKLEIFLNIFDVLCKYFLSTQNCKLMLWSVCFSVIEVMQQGSGGLSVLRTFRLLRILKLVRFMPALRHQLLVMLRTMDNVATFFSLLALFIFIFR